MSYKIVLIILISTAAFAKKYGGGGGYGSGRYSSHGHGTKSHTYPSSTGYSGSGTGGSHSYPASTGLSGNRQQNQHVTQQQQPSQYNTHHSHTTKTEVHHHYHYNPPPHISYGSQTLPVYQGHPPVYVYEYRNSGSRFDTLLTGLALYNLGKLSANHHHHDDYRYTRNPGEICKLGIRKTNGDYEETRIDCQLMSSFIWEAQASPNEPSKKVVSSVVNETVTTNNGTVTSSVTVTNTTVVDALAVKGPSLEVKPGMKCYLLRVSRDSSVLKKTVDCGILQTYATSSLRRNKSESLMPMINILVFGYIVSYLLH